MYNIKYYYINFVHCTVYTSYKRVISVSALDSRPLSYFRPSILTSNYHHTGLLYALNDLLSLSSSPLFNAQTPFGLSFRFVAELQTIILHTITLNNST